MLPTLCPVVLLVGCETPPDVEWDSVRLIEAATPDEASQYLAQECVSVLVLGPGLHSDAMRSLLERSIAENHDKTRFHILSGTGIHTEPFQLFIDHDQIFYLSRGPLRSGHLKELILACATHSDNRRGSKSMLLSPTTSDRSLAFCLRMFLQTDSTSAGRLLAESVREEIAADEVQCFLHDCVNQVLRATNGASRVESTAAGIAGYVARTGVPVIVERVGDDPRYDAECDNPEGRADTRLLAEPIFANPDAIIGVITAARPATGEPFSPQDVNRVAALADLAAPSMNALLLQESAQSMVSARNRGAGYNPEIYRREALDFCANGQEEEGDVLEPAPVWMRMTHLVTVAIFLLIVMYAFVARVDETTAGPVFVRARSKGGLNSTMEGLVRSVRVAAGGHLRTGDVLLEFYEPPSAHAPKASGGQMRASKEGLISEVLVQPGQHVSPGDPIATIINEKAGYELTALFPRSQSPHIRTGMPITLKLAGYQDSQEIVTIDRIGTENGDDELRKAASQGTGGVMGTFGPVLVVHATLPQSFASGSEHFAFKEGMTGTGELRLRSEPLIASLPGLKNLMVARR